jgi:hypothetical protein
MHKTSRYPKETSDSIDFRVLKGLSHEMDLAFDDMYR